MILTRVVFYYRQLLIKFLIRDDFMKMFYKVIHGMAKIEKVMELYVHSSISEPTFCFF